MKLFAPQYYKEFACIADRCKHSCCVGWEIDVDGEALCKYQALDGYGKEIAKSIDYNETPHFQLAENDRCPHLNGRGLCRIILECGEEYLCDICREHPRFYNYTTRGKEVGLGMSCEEACRIILSSDRYAEFCEVGENNEYLEDVGFDAVNEREALYSILSDRSAEYEERLFAISKRYEISPRRASDEEWRDIIDSLEYLDETRKTLFLNYSSNAETPKDFENQLERALAYFVYRHCAEAENAEDFRASLGFCLFCERLLASLVSSQKPENLEQMAEYARILSEEIEYSEDNTQLLKDVFA